MKRILLFSLFLCNLTFAYSEEYRVQEGDHVVDILISQQYPMSTQEQQQFWLDEMLRLNQSKFIWGDIDLIRPGSVLTLPDNPNRKSRILPEPVFSIEIPSLIGEIDVVSGEVHILAKDGLQRSIKQKSPLFEGDSLVTSNNNISKITMIDDAKLELGGNSKISFEVYEYDSDQPKKSNVLTQFFHGVMRSTTGLIGKYAPDKFAINTPVVLIGIRGTDYIARHCEGDQCGDYLGSSLAVIEGGIATQSEQGSVELNKGEFVAVSPSGELSEVRPIPEGFLDLASDVSQLDSHLNWWQRLKHQVHNIIN